MSNTGNKGRDHGAGGHDAEGFAAARQRASSEHSFGADSSGAEILNCAAALELIPAYLDDELSEPRAAPLRRHLLACHACREEAQAERAQQRWFVPNEPVEVPAGFAERVTRLAYSGALPEQARPLATPNSEAAPEAQRLRVFLLRAVAVAAAVLLTFALVLQLRNRPSGEDLHADELPALWQPSAVVPTDPRPASSDAPDAQQRTRPLASKAARRTAPAATPERPDAGAPNGAEGQR